MTFSQPVPSLVFPGTVLVVVAGFLAISDARTMPVTLPLAIGLLAATAFFATLWRRGYGRLPWFELGVVYVTVVTLYMAYPLIGFLALNGTYTPVNDGRLVYLHPDSREAGSVGWLYVCHLMGFAAAYLAVRGRLPWVRPRPCPPPLAVGVAIGVGYLLIVAFEVTLGLVYDTSASTYAESYLVTRRLPLLVAQVVNHLDGAKYPLALALLALLFTDYSRTRPIIVGWLLVTAVLSVVRLGSRTEMVMLVLSSTMMYHALVRPLPARFIGATAVVGLAGFLAFGVLRNGWLPVPGHSILNPFVTASEFEVLFTNAIHLQRVKDTISSLPLAFYLHDLAGLVPQQVLPVAKFDAAAWYVGRFFPLYAERGGGLAFGTIAEAVLTGGWVSALCRGAVLGVAFAAIHRLSVRHAHGFWMFVFYIWISTLAYQSFRSTTLALGVLFVYRFMAAVVMVTLLARALVFLSRPRPSLVPQPTVRP